MNKETDVRFTTNNVSGDISLTGLTLVTTCTEYNCTVYNISYAVQYYMVYNTGGDPDTPTGE